MNQYNQAPNLVQDITWESDKNTIKHHIQESQEISPFPVGDHKAAMKSQENTLNTIHKYQKRSTKKHCLETVSKTTFLEGLKIA